MKSFLTLATIVLLLGLTPNVMAQETATVTGTVTDATGALIPGAEVTATNTNTGISTLRVSGEAGSYSIAGLQAGSYSIVAALPGFSDSTIEVDINANQTFRFNFELQVGAVATAVEVISDADALLATTGASVGDALPQEEVFALPLATRDVFDLLASTAGLVRSSNGDATNFAGGRNSSVNTTRDGIPVSDGRYLDWNGSFSATYSSPDLVEEVQISVGTVDAAAGRGSSQVRLQTRSGTNEFHGALFYTTNNSALNANTWFNNLTGKGMNWTNRNQYGGRLGGPIARNKAFFFVLIDNQEYRTRANATGAVWTATARQGIFRYFPGVENDNALGGAGASVNKSGTPTKPAAATGDLASFNLFTDVKDVNRGTGISNSKYLQETLRRMPAPNDFTTGDGLNTAGISWVRRESGDDNSAGTSQDTNRRQLNIRFDYQISDSNKINIVMSRERDFGENSMPTWPGGLSGRQHRTPRIYSASYTASVTPSVLNELRLGYRLTNWHGRTAFTDGCCFGDGGFGDGLTDYGKTAYEFFSFSNNYPYMPTLQSIGGNKWMAIPALGSSRGQDSPLYTISDTVSWVVGAHSFQAGFEANWADSDGWNSGGLWPRADIGSGNFPVTNIEGKFTGLQNADADVAEAILNDLSGSVGSQRMGFIVNNPAKGFDTILDTPKQNLNFHQDDWAAFIKDDWNATQNLTINYGLRWDVYGVPYEAKGLAPVAKDGNYLGISGNGSLTAVEQVGRFSLNPDKSIYPKDWNNFAPSVGFSYNIPWLDRTTVLRGGYGVSYSGAPTFLQYDFGVGRQAGKSYTANSTPAKFTAVTGITGAPNATLATFPLTNPIEPFGTIPVTDRRASFYHYAADRRIPYIQNINISIETELAANTNLSIAWVSTNGVSLWGGRQINEPNIFDAKIGSESFLQAFITTREGGNSAYFNTMLNGINFGSGTCGVVNGTTCTGSAALRASSRTRGRVADGDSAGLAEYMNQSNSFTGAYGGMIRTNSLPENHLVLNPQFNQVDYYDNGDHSSYHSMQVQLTKRLSQGFSGQITYTWSKAIGNAAMSTFRAREDQSFGTRDWRNRNMNKGVVTFHRSHAWNAHGVWSLPFGPGRLLGSNAPSAVARLIEGWQLSTIFSWNTGQPVSITASRETISAEDNFNTPDLSDMSAFPRDVGEVTIGSTGNVTYFPGLTRAADTTNYFGTDPNGLASRDRLYQINKGTTAILTNAKPGTTGNLSGLWVEGPTRLGLDVAASKSVQITEGTEFTLRMDAINMLNSPQWGNPNGNINSSSFGKITSASGSRTFTLNARIDF